MAINPFNETICTSGLDSKGMFYGDNPLHFSSPLMLSELMLATSMTIACSLLLKPLGIPEMISHILAGVLLGPSLIGRIPGFHDIFNLRHYRLLDTFGDFGSMFQFFLMGIQVNPAIIRTAGRRDIVIGISVLLVPLMFSLSSAKIIATAYNLDHKSYRSLLTIGISESMNAFPVIICYLTELNFLNLEFSRLAISSSMITSILCISSVWSLRILETTSTMIQTSSNFKKGRQLLPTLASYGLVVAVVLNLLRPLIRWMVKKTPEGQKLKEHFVCPILLITLMLAWFCNTTKIYMPFGPLLFGMIIPPGSPLASALVERLEFFNKWIIMPIYYTVYSSTMKGSNLNIKFELEAGFVVLISFAGKFLGAFLPARFYNMSYKDSTLLGLTMNAQGFVEVTVFRYLISNELVNHGSLEVMSALMIIVTGGMTPLIRYLYRSSMEQKLQNKKTIQHSEPNAVLRVLTCVYDMEHVPSVIHFLKATHPTKERPVNATIIHFMELVGRATPLIVSHKTNRKQIDAVGASERIVSLFKRYEKTSPNSISLHPYTVVSPYASLHDDVCTIALQKWTSLIILPYHKQTTTGTTNRGILTVNCSVLEKAPCSVGILIDRGILGGTNFIFEDWSSYHVAMFFIGGPDDREALAIGTRMSNEPTLKLTVIRLLPSGNQYTEKTERSLDDDMILEFKHKTYHNERVTYLEAEVDDGFGVTQLIESMKNRYELILLGRRHDRNSPLIIGLTDWNKCSELGTIGDIFTTAPHADEASILVVQQQTSVAASSWDILEDDDEKPIYDC